LPEENGSTSDAKTAGASYLAALKEMSAPAAAAPARTPASRADDGSDAALRATEKRRSPRYRCQGSIHLRDIGSDVATWAAFTDISLHGCYVEAMSVFRVGADLSLTMEVNAYRVECRGVVQVVYPGVGMGIAFTAISEENRERLRELLRSLVQPSMILGTRSGLDRGGVPATVNSPPVKDPAAALQAISDFFKNRHMLGREEFLQILRKSQR
jgi:hypothetical protein